MSRTQIVSRSVASEPAARIKRIARQASSAGIDMAAIPERATIAEAILLRKVSQPVHRRDRQTIAALVEVAGFPEVMQGMPYVARRGVATDAPNVDASLFQSANEW